MWWCTKMDKYQVWAILTRAFLSITISSSNCIYFLTNLSRLASLAKISRYWIFFLGNFSIIGLFAKKGRRMRLQMHFVKKAETSLIGGFVLVIFYHSQTFFFQYFPFISLLLYVPFSPYTKFEEQLIWRQAWRNKTFWKDQITWTKQSCTK